MGCGASKAIDTQTQRPDTYSAKPATATAPQQQATAVQPQQPTLQSVQSQGASVKASKPAAVEYTAFTPVAEAAASADVPTSTRGADPAAATAPTEAKPQEAVQQKQQAIQSVTVAAPVEQPKPVVAQQSQQQLQQPPVAPVATNAPTVTAAIPVATAAASTEQPVAATAAVAVETPISEEVDDEEEEITGVLWKRGESGTPGATKWKQRFVVIKTGELSYYSTQEAYESNKAPIKGNRIRLSNYTLRLGLPEAPPALMNAAALAGELTGTAPSAQDQVNMLLAVSSFYLDPLPSTPSPRRWEWRAVDQRDYADWLDVFVEEGCRDGRREPAPLAPLPAATATSTSTSTITVTTAAAPVAVPAGAPEAPVSTATATANAGTLSTPPTSSSAAMPLVAATPVPATDVPEVKPAAQQVPAIAAAASSETASIANSQTASSSSSSSATATSVAHQNGGLNPSAALNTSPIKSSAGSSDAGVAASTAVVAFADAAARERYHVDPSSDASAAAAPGFKSGVLEKQGEEGSWGGASFKKRWFLVKGGLMTYWETEKDRSKKGAKPLKGNFVVLSEYSALPEGPGTTNMVRLVPVSSAGQTRVWAMRTSSPAEQKEWVAAFIGAGAAPAPGVAADGTLIPTVGDAGVTAPEVAASMAGPLEVLLTATDGSCASTWVPVSAEIRGHYIVLSRAGGAGVEAVGGVGPGAVAPLAPMVCDLKHRTLLEGLEITIGTTVMGTGRALLPGVSSNDAPVVCTLVPLDAAATAASSKSKGKAGANHNSGCATTAGAHTSATPYTVVLRAGSKAQRDAWGNAFVSAGATANLS